MTTETFTVTPADRGLTDSQYAVLRALEEGQLSPADQRQGSGAYEEELLDLEAAGLVRSHRLLEGEPGADDPDALVWTVTPQGRQLMKGIGTWKLPAVPAAASAPPPPVSWWATVVAAGLVSIVAVGIIMGWW